MIKIILPSNKTGFRQSSSYWVLYSNCWNASFGVTYCTVTYLRGPKLLLGGDELTSKPWWNAVCPGNKFIWITFLRPSEMDSIAWLSYNTFPLSKLLFTQSCYLNSNMFQNRIWFNRCLKHYSVIQVPENLNLVVQIIKRIDVTNGMKL